MAVKDMTFLQNAPLNSWLALNSDETEVLVSAPSLMELEEAATKLGLQDDDFVVFKTPPRWGRFAL